MWFDAEGFRESEDIAFMEGLGQTWAQTLFYGNTVANPAQFMGLSPFFNTKSTATAKNATNVIDAGLTAQRESGWFGALRARHFGEAPLVEDNSARSAAYTTVDAQIGFKKSNEWLAALDVFNVFNVKWNDIEYYYVSRLQNEASPSPDFVVHPGVPRTVRAHFQYFL